MLEKPTAQHPLGLESEEKFLKGALLRLKGDKPIVERLFKAELTQRDATPRHLNLLHTIEPPLPRDKLRRALFVSGMTTRETLIRPLDIKLTKEKDIDAVLGFQSEPLLPYPVDEAILDRVILSTSEEGSQLAVFAVRKDHLESHLEFYQSLNIEPEAVSCHPSALAAFSKAYSEVNEPLIVTHLGLKETCCLLVDDGKVLSAFSINLGLEGLIQAAKENDISLADADFVALGKDENSPLYPHISALEQGLNRTVFALGKQASGRSISLMMFTGEGACMGNFVALLAERCGKTPVAPEAPWDTGITTDELQRFALPIGLALGYLPESRNRISFRRGELAYPNPWKRLKQPVAIYVLGCLLVALLVALMSGVVVSRHEVSVHREYARLLSILGKEHETFENEAFGTASDDIIPIDELSTAAINKRLDWIEQDIKKTPHSFPLMPNVARVSDVLAWIVTHPKVAPINTTTGEREPHLQLESFNYTMLKRPDKTKQRERYQVKVEFEFSSDEPKWAREFHDALIAPNDLIDPKGEVKWSAAQGKYRTSFFLKDRTYYP